MSSYVVSNVLASFMRLRLPGVLRELQLMYILKKGIDVFNVSRIHNRAGYLDNYSGGATLENDPPGTAWAGITSGHPKRSGTLILLDSAVVTAVVTEWQTARSIPERMMMRSMLLTALSANAFRLVAASICAVFFRQRKTKRIAIIEPAWPCVTLAETAWWRAMGRCSAMKVNWFTKAGIDFKRVHSRFVHFSHVSSFTEGYESSRFFFVKKCRPIV